ncbi:hypothetical protein E4U42_002394 [Claviceps africana]|uniref:Uncharacterized protein n=1 Tax=Claviceps africana TaxID=83212 RepID=A0A8K0JAQ8_9HYPO|nr:hypothetical protein E4U42_002394 [Claviceps africana]
MEHGAGSLTDFVYQLVEFYVACNPPLSPSGVQQFMQELENAPFQKEGNKVVEILYEMRGPWFKVITCRVFKAEVTDAIKTLLAAITEENTVPLEQPEEYRGRLADVHTTSHTIPWSAFPVLACHTEFLRWEFPVTMQDLAFKATWPPDSENLVFNLGEMLHMQSHLDGSQTENPKVDSLAPLLGCMVSSNLRETMLYIGTNNSRETLDNAQIILDILFNLTAVATTTQHIIYTPESKEQLFCYKWLLHIGLATRTFPQLPTEDVERLRYAVSIRAVSQGPQKRQASYRRHGGLNAQNVSRDAASKNCLSTLFLQRKYPPKREQKSSPNCEITVSTNSTSPNLDSFQHTTVSCPSPPESEQIESYSDSELRIGMDELLLFDMDDLSQSGNQSPAPQHVNQPSLVSLLDDDPPANLVLSILEPNSPESKLNEARLPSIWHILLPHVIKLLEEHVVSLWPFLEQCPGFVTVRLQFGRFYLTDLKSAHVDIGSGPYRTMADLRRELEAVERERIGFSTILSGLKSDANLLVNYPTSPWVYLEEDKTCQIQCTLDEKQLSIDVDATTFDFSCRGPWSELACTLVHCVHQAWDLKLAVNHSSNLNISAAHQTVGQAIANSLQIRTDVNGTPIFELIASGDGWFVESVRTRHTTRFKSTQTPGSILTVAKFQTLRPSEEKSKRRRWTIPKNASSKGPHPESWLEAYVSASTLDAMLEENVNLALGGRLPWDVSQQHAICDGLFEPALETVARLDDVGNNNDNGMSGGKLDFNDSVAEARERSGQPKEEFW